ncbi:sodium- and chloride-dependent neutral and basic amino acid transporter B(0+)-like isoform X2 [Lissotriton helveticus]
MKSESLQQHLRNMDAQVAAEDESPERGTWSNKADYLLSMVGYAVGLGNVWRFPYLAYKNGGGAFLIPYMIVLVLTGMPLFFLESSLGQFASIGPVLVWKVVPIVQGVGITMVITSTIVSIYYNVIVAYSLYYLFASFQRILPWSDCSNWANETCSKPLRDECNMTLDTKGKNVNCISNDTSGPPQDLPSKLYWDNVALRRSSGLDDTGVVVWYLVLCNLLAWIMVAAALFRGIKSSGKVVYFTAIFPYVVLLILLIRGATLEGAGEGIAYYIGTKSNITKLWEAEVWKDAATQIFYSYCIASGGLVTLSSYSKFNNNCYLDAIFVCCINGLTSLFAGFAIFSILGHMAHVLGKPVSKVVESGFGLAFIAYPEALTTLPISPLWSILFFLMLLTLGFDSQLSYVEILTTSIQDAIPELMKRFRIVITAGCCMILFLLGIPCVTQAGIYWVSLIDYYCGGWTLLIAALLELVAITWIYGANRFIEDIEMMIGKKHWIFWLWWRVSWYFISPVLITAILIWSLAMFKTPTYGTIVYPVWGEILGWGMIVFCIIWIPVIAIYKIVKADGSIFQAILLWSLVTFETPTYGSIKYPVWGTVTGWCILAFCLLPIPLFAITTVATTDGSLFQRIKKSCAPTDKWGPALQCNRGERYKNAVDVANGQLAQVNNCSLVVCDNEAYF